jgi:hypothetical protein
MMEHIASHLRMRAWEVKKLAKLGVPAEQIPYHEVSVEKMQAAMKDFWERDFILYYMPYGVKRGIGPDLLYLCAESILKKSVMDFRTG